MDPQKLRLMADLIMAVQGFRPPPARAAQFVSEGLAWSLADKPPKYGLTSGGKLTLTSLAFEGSQHELSALMATARRFTPSVTEFADGTVFLDDLESKARSGDKLAPTFEQAVFLLWILSEIPSLPPNPSHPAKHLGEG